MPDKNPLRNRPKIFLSGVAATALAVAGLSLMSSPTEAAPAPAAAPAKKGYAGAPVNPTPYTVTQPDGSTLKVHRFGDHLSNGIATVKGNYTLVKGSDGYYRYAAGLTAAGKLKPSSVVAGQGTPPAGAQDLAPAADAEPTPSKAPMAGTGNDRELVILAQFQDVTHKATGSTEADWANHYFGATGSVDDFYDEASNGQFGVKAATEACGTTPNDGVTGWITLPMNHPNTGVDDSASEQYIADAIKATEGCVDYASYDTAPADGELTTNELHVTIIGAGFETSYGGDECGKSIWGHEWDLGSAGIVAPVVDGKTIGNSGYTTFGEWHCDAGDNPGHKATMGIMAHEFGHDINFPDLYDTDQSGEGIGEWSLMAGGSWGDDGGFPGNSPAWPDAFSLYYQGWVVPTPVTTATNNISVGSHQSLLLGPNPGGTNWLFNETEGDGEYFLVENRNHTGYDQSTPGCGIIVYRIDETVTPSNSANNSTNDPLVRVIQADNLNELTTGHADRGDAGDPYPGSTNNHDLSDSTSPNSKFHDGVASNLSLHVDDNAGCLPTMSVDVLQPGGPSTPVVRPSNDMFANAVTLTGASPANQTKNTAHATVETGEPKPAGAGRASVWYRWVAPAPGTVTVQTTGSSYDTVLGLYTGSAVDALTQVAANDDQVIGSVFTSKVVTHVTAGTTYQIAADGYGGDSGNLTLAVNLVADPATTITATHAPEPSAFGSASSVSVTVGGGVGTATGAVTVKEGATTIGTGTLDGTGKAIVALPATLAAGSHSLAVSYPGDASHTAVSGTVTATVSKASSTTSATAKKKVPFKKDFDVTATVTAAGGSNTGTVQVYDGKKLIGTGTLSNGTVKIEITKNLKSGKHTLTVKYLGSANASASETTVKVKVQKKKKS